MLTLAMRITYTLTRRAKASLASRTAGVTRGLGGGPAPPRRGAARGGRGTAVRGRPPGRRAGERGRRPCRAGRERGHLLQPARCGGRARSGDSAPRAGLSRRVRPRVARPADRVGAARPGQRLWGHEARPRAGVSRRGGGQGDLGALLQPPRSRPGRRRPDGGVGTSARRGRARRPARASRRPPRDGPRLPRRPRRGRRLSRPRRERGGGARQRLLGTRGAAAGGGRPAGRGGHAGGLDRDRPGTAPRADPPTVVGDPGRLRVLTGWAPARHLEESLSEVLEDWRRRLTSAPAPASGAGAPSPPPVVAVGR